MDQSDSLADQHLLHLIRIGDQDGWAQFVRRYQGRMIAFTRGQIGDQNDAEDLVQESFLGFLRSLEGYRQQSRIESWLFRILRRRIIDYYRARGTHEIIPACRLKSDAQQSDADDPIKMAIDPGATPSTYARREEASAWQDATLSAALDQVISQMKDDENLSDLMIVEGSFYAQLRNRDLAQLIEVDANRIAVVRHRLLKRLQDHVSSDDVGGNAASLPLPSPDLLTRIWERDRPSCLKRTTLGKSLIGILEPRWQTYVDFHVDTLGCQYCQANRQDLDRDQERSDDSVQAERILQSTIGFVSRPTDDRPEANG